MDPELREYLDTRFGEVRESLHHLSERTTTLETKLAGGAITTELCEAHRQAQAERLEDVSGRVETLSQRQWGALVGTFLALLAAIGAFLTGRN